MSDICYNCFQEKISEGPCPHCGYDPSHARDDYPLALPHGSVLNGRYVLGRVLGQGGFGITYVAQEHRSGKLVAVKEYLPDGMAARTGSHAVTAYSGERGESFLYGKECFLKEAQTLAEFIGNPNIVRVHSYFEENGTAYLVMDYVEGISFQRYIQDHGGKIGWQDALRVLLPVMEALEAVHGRGIIHRDVTPDNIFLTGSGEVRLLDFGAARYSLGDRSRSLDVVLKHGFAPKEQYTRHGRQGPYTDVYSVAASFYYAVTGRKPPDAIDRIDEDSLFPPSSLGASMPAEAEDAILKGLSVNPSDRFQSMGNFVAALTHSSPSPAPAPTPSAAPTPVLSKKRIIPMAVVCAVLLAVISFALFPWKPWESRSQQAFTDAEQLPSSSEPGSSSMYAENQQDSTDTDKQYPSEGSNLPFRDTADTSAEPMPEKSSEPIREETGMLFGDTIAAGYLYTVGLKADGMAVATGHNEDGQCEVSSWRDIVSISAGYRHSVGLKADGTAIAVGNNENGQCEVSGWRDIVSVSAGYEHTVGLKADGTVVAVGDNTYGQCEVNGWRDIVSVSARSGYTVGLKMDGTVVAVGYNEEGECEVSGWRDVDSVSAGGWHTVGLKADGTVVAVGENGEGQCNVSSWTDIVAVSAGYWHTVGLKADGTVVAVGSNEDGECEVSGWTDIVSVSAGYDHTVGLKSDGTVAAVGKNKDGQCYVNGWANMVIPNTWHR